jgi:hypothetical protein
MRTWNFTVDGSDHSVQVAHDPIFSGELEIYVDGKEVVKTIVPRGKNYEYKCTIEKKQCVVRIGTSSMGAGGMTNMSISYDVLIGGTSQKYSGALDLVPPKK